MTAGHTHWHAGREHTSYPIAGGLIVSIEWQHPHITVDELCATLGVDPDTIGPSL